ncbi:DUF2513 domain-containing protein [Cedecea sp. NFIX57]|uniref:DUF2513 domain-containing protein n=1 Tax=Cedecea sp. NFIX57 TaxID=1566286 RepID=UPI000A0A8A4A|nr:DUF2513 domain-containing protein [Cedecea sp. NFIX57]SMG62043.1 Hypothetical protein SAMN03159353_11074 [Cedecea sp. NFIX57]
MKIDFDELKRMLDKFLEAEGPFITLSQMGFPEESGEEEDKFLFHLLLLVDNRLISNAKLETGDPAAIGLVYTMSRRIGIRNVPIRLTQSGHDFAKALHQPPVLERIKKELAEAPLV